jgi:hypothetical protein
MGNWNFSHFTRALCGLVVRVPGCRTEMYCASCEVWTEFIYVMEKKVDRLCGLVVRVPGYTTHVLCFLWGMNWIYICCVEESRPPLWSSGQSSWLQVQRSLVRFPALPDFLRSSGSGTGSTEPCEYMDHLTVTTLHPSLPEAVSPLLFDIFIALL